MSYAAAGHSIVRASIILSRVKTPRPCRRGIAACLGPRRRSGGVLLLEIGFVSDRPAAISRARMEEWNARSSGALSLRLG